MIIYTHIEYNTVASIVYWYAMCSGFCELYSVWLTNNSKDSKRLLAQDVKVIYFTP